jgi:hypothetical protein
MKQFRHLFRVAALSMFALVVLTSCAARQPIQGQETSALDRKLSTFAYIEQGDLMTLIVDTRATRYREKSPYIPLEIVIANNGLRQIVLTLESFTLIDEEGNRYPAASPRELIEGYEFLDLDRNQLAELEGIVFNKFAAYAKYPSMFSPTRDFTSSRSNIVRDLVSLPKFGYLLDFIYFPAPKNGLLGKRFELHVDSQQLEDTVFVKFEVK